MYKSICYRLFDKASTWSQSKAACQAEGGNLASILDIGTNNFIENLSKGKPRFWTGGFQTGSTWKWADNSAWSFENWPAGEPNGSGGECMVLNWDTNWDWNDHICQDTYGYVCEKN